jgi:hypothetical protein
MKELVGFFAWDLEANKPFTRDNGLSAFAAMDDCFRFHGSPPELCLDFLVGQLVLDRFQVFVGFLQAGAGLVDGSEDGDVVDSDAHFELMFLEEPLDQVKLFSKSLVWRVIRRRIDLLYEVIPSDVAHDWNGIPAFLPVQKTEIGRNERDEQKRTENQKADCFHMGLFFTSFARYVSLNCSLSKSEQLRL